MSQKNLLSKLVLIILFIFSLSVISATAQEERLSPTLEKGIGLYKHENFDEALPVLIKARQESPDSTIAAYYFGLNYKKLQDYQSAIPPLRDAVTKTPKIKGALIELIDALYSVNELEEAKKWIREAEEEGIRPAQVSFLKGLVLLKEEKLEPAIESFENAKALDKTMEQACDYQIGIAHLKARDYNYAKKAFEDVVVLESYSNIAQYANEYLDAITKRMEVLKPWKINASMAWQYDDNVVLKPGDESIASQITNEADSRRVMTANLEYNKIVEQVYGMKAQYLLYYSDQDELSFYDTLSQTAVIQPSIYLEKGLLTFPISYTHSTVHKKSYLSSPAVSAFYNRMISKSQMGQVSLKYANKDFKWSPSTPDEDRDGNDLSGTLGWYFFFAEREGFLNLKYGLNRDWTEGDNWDYLGNRLTVTALIPVVDKLKVTLSGNTFFQDFLNTHTVFNEEREDTVYTATTMIGYDLLKNCQAQLQYTFIKNDSNINVYTYERNIYSAGVQVKF